MIEFVLFLIVFALLCINGTLREIRDLMDKQDE